MPILYLLFYLLFGVLFVLNLLAKWIAKGTRCNNPYIRNGIKTIMWLTIILSICYGYYTYQKRDIISFDKLMVKPTIEECQSFIDDYPNSKKVSGVKSWINKRYEQELRAANDSLSLSLFINKYSNNYSFKEDYKKPFLDKAIKLLDKEKKRLEYERYERMKREQVEWNSEARAWQTASEKGSLEMYHRYLKLYPNGEHVSQVTKMIIDLEVAAVFQNGNYGQLPSMDKIGYGKGAYSTVTVVNNTEYSLTLLYSGVESKRVIINSYGTQDVQLKSDFYRIVASVNARGVRSFAGTEDLTGGNYCVSYYISTSK